jgi:hypothetical protein
MQTNSASAGMAITILPRKRCFPIKGNNARAKSIGGIAKQAAKRMPRSNQPICSRRKPLTDFEP